MKKIAIDMDDVLAEISTKVLRLYEDTYQVKLKESDYLGKNYYQLDGLMELRPRLQEKGFFRNLPVMADSQEVVQKLQENYEVFITTAAMGFRNSLTEKFDWLQEHFPFIESTHYVFCGSKSIIRADYMIDDHSYNLKKFVGKGLLYTAPHNVEEDNYTRVDTWQEVALFFKEELRHEAQ